MGGTKEIEKLTELSARALKDLGKTKSFYTELYGKAKAQQITDDIFKRIEILEDFRFREIGPLDEDFSHLKGEYRKLIENYVKITYRIGKTKIYIVRVFDTRQNPKKNL